MVWQSKTEAEFIQYYDVVDLVLGLVNCAHPVIVDYKPLFIA